LHQQNYPTAILAFEEQPGIDRETEVRSVDSFQSVLRDIMAAVAILKKYINDTKRIAIYIPKISSVSGVSQVRVIRIL
jgi:hypothetical protein